MLKILVLAFCISVTAAMVNPLTWIEQEAQRKITTVENAANGVFRSISHAGDSAINEIKAVAAGAVEAAEGGAQQVVTSLHDTETAVSNTVAEFGQDLGAVARGATMVIKTPFVYVEELVKNSVHIIIYVISVVLLILVVGMLVIYYPVITCQRGRQPPQNIEMR